MAPEPQPVCVVCNEPAFSRCSACKLGANIRHYCGKACQAKDWPEHKKECKEIRNQHLEKALSRAAEIVQQAYHGFREHTWDIPIQKIVDDDDVLHIYDGDSHKKAKYFIEFPNHLTENEQTKKAVLCESVCSESWAWMHNLVTALVKGLDVKVEEVRVSVGTVPRKITVHMPHGGVIHNWMSTLHDILRLSSTKTKKQWIFDISGAQYGIYNAFWSWTDYTENFTVDLKKVYPFGTCNDVIKELGKVRGDPSMVYGVVGIVAEQLNAAVKEWVDSRGLSLAKMITLDEYGYGEAKLSLLQSVKSSVCSFVAMNDFEIEFKLAKSYERMHPRRSEREGAAIRKAFFGGGENIASTGSVPTILKSSTTIDL